ncbi:MAG TPA: glycosyltransferase family 39 protein, partial [Candidatus Acidoferrales bacterium]|nr:glycosyltransferase family 39 protein [Candidatus Acidoferrales bacterium]
MAIVVDAAHRVVWATYTDRDIEIYATIARFWRDGFIPYRDLYDFKPPLTFVALRAGYALWGDELQSFWRVILVLTAAGALTMYAGLRRAGCCVAAPLAGLGLMTLVVADPMHIVSLNTELLAAACGAGAFGCAAVYDRDHRWWWAVAAGGWMGLATLSKQPAILWLLPVVVQLWLSGAQGGRWRRLQVALMRAALVAAGFAAVVG